MLVWEGGRHEKQGAMSCADGVRETRYGCRALIRIVVGNEIEASRRGLDGTPHQLTSTKSPGCHGAVEGSGVCVTRYSDSATRRPVMEKFKAGWPAGNHFIWQGLQDSGHCQ